MNRFNDFNRSSPFQFVEAQVGENSMNRMRRRVNRQVFEHLLRYPYAKTADPKRFEGGTDRDYIALLNQLRRYFYGNLSDSEINRLLSMPFSPSVVLGGQVALFPAVSSNKSWKELDRYTRTTVFRALNRRRKLLEEQHPGQQFPDIWYGKYSRFDRGYVISGKGENVSLALPSTAKMFKLVKRTVNESGPTRLRNNKGIYQL
mgnify:CR=1 FL=1